MHMSSKDLKDAFFSAPIYVDHQKELKFLIKFFFQFTCVDMTPQSEYLKNI